MTFSPAPRALFLLTLIALASGCSARDAVTFGKAAVVLETSGGETTVNVEVAVTERQRSRGLMFRKRLNDGEGMLFVFERDQTLSFWMKDTRIPLSIAFISSDGAILEIKDMEPHSLNPVRSSRSARYALEVPQGWFGRAGAAPGALVRIPEL
jgi:uncharacterized membrane protein (UPF0127 family)